MRTGEWQRLVDRATCYSATAGRSESLTHRLSLNLSSGPEDCWCSTTTRLRVHGRQSSELFGGTTAPELSGSRAWIGQLANFRLLRTWQSSLPCAGHETHTVL